MKLKKDLDKLVNKALEINLDSKVKDWYLQEYSTDTIGEDINSEITFAQVLDNPYKIDQEGKLAGDSVVRERVFEKISELIGKPYNYIYQRWSKPELFENVEDTDNMIQCVLKIEDIGNEYKYLGMVEDNSNYASEYDMENHFIDRLDGEDPTIQFVLAYHKDGEEVFYDEEGDPLNLNIEEQKEFEQAYQDAINSKDNTVIPDASMIESLSETYEKFNVEGVDFAFQDRPDGLVQITQIRPYSMQNWSWAIGKLDPREDKDASFGLYKVNRDNGDKVDTLITIRDSKEEVAKWMLRKDKDLQYLVDRT